MNSNDMTATAEENTQLNQIQQAVDRMERALLGDSQLGDDGLVKRFVSVEKKVQKHDRTLKAAWGIFSFLLASLAYNVYDFFQKK